MDNNLFANKPTSPGVPWDVVIVGSGPAGLTAAIYTTRGAASTLVLGGEKWGGQLMLTSIVDNFPGFQDGIEGPLLMENMKNQAVRFGAEFRPINVTSVDFSSRPFKLTANDQQLLAKSVIIATGAETKWLGAEGEDKLIGRGVSSCAPCDAPFFKDKKVVVVGGGDSAMEEALVLTKYASSVTIIHRKSEFRASKAMQQKVFDNPKVSVIWDTEISAVKGDVKLESLTIKNIISGEVGEIATDGLFVAIGHIPSSEIFKGLIDLDEKGFIKPKEGAKTNIEGVFVSGDIHDHTYKQAVTAAGYGCQAGMEALNYLAG
jgi:thioredoxin reductase (NADPH)